MFEQMQFSWSYFEGMDELPDDVQLSLYRAIIRYGFLQEEPELTGIAKYAFGIIRPDLDAQAEDLLASNLAPRKNLAGRMKEGDAK